MTCSDKSCHKTGDQKKPKSLMRRLLKWGLVCMVLFCVGVYALYYFSTIPKYSVSDIRKLIAESHKALSDIPQEEKRLGEEIIALLEKLPERPWDDEKVPAWHESVKASGQLKAFYALLRRGPAAYEFDYSESGPIGPIRDGMILVQNDFIQALTMQSREDVLIIYQNNVRLAESLENSRLQVWYLFSMLTHNRMLINMLSSMNTVDSDILNAMIPVMAEVEARFPEPAPFFRLENPLGLELVMKEDLSRIKGGAWLHKLERGRVKTLSVAMDAHLRALEIVQKPFCEAIPLLQDLQDEMSDERHSWVVKLLKYKSYTKSIAHNFIMDWYNCYYRYLRQLAHFRGVRIAMALELHHRKTGKYPGLLKDLVPSVLPALPEDPFTGLSFCYSRKGNDYLLYCTGNNQRDDQGDLGSFYEMAREERFLLYNHRDRNSGDVVIVRPPEKQ